MNRDPSTTGMSVDLLYFTDSITSPTIMFQGGDQFFTLLIFELIPDIGRVFQTVTSISDMEGRGLEAGSGISS